MKPGPWQPPPKEAPGAGALHVCITVATYRRPDDIVRCLAGLMQEVAVAPDRTRVRVVVVDNDPAAGARMLVTSLGDDRVTYLHEPRPGIAAARNKALTACRGEDLVVFIDDDEEPRPGWLKAMLATREAHAADVVAGRVLSSFERPLDEWLAAGRFFERRSLPTGTPIDVAATNNLMVDVALVERLGLRFDDRFGLSGGSDTLFTRRLALAGATMVWCDEAVVVDHVPPQRQSRQWVLARARRMGNTEVVVDLALACNGRTALRRRVKGFVRGGVRVITGGCGEVVGSTCGSTSIAARGARRRCRGRGMLEAALGHQVFEYRRGAGEGQRAMDDASL